VCGAVFVPVLCLNRPVLPSRTPLCCRRLHPLQRLHPNDSVLFEMIDANNLRAHLFRWGQGGGRTRLKISGAPVQVAGGGAHTGVPVPDRLHVPGAVARHTPSGSAWSANRWAW